HQRRCGLSSVRGWPQSIPPFDKPVNAERFHAAAGRRLHTASARPLSAVGAAHRQLILELHFKDQYAPPRPWLVRRCGIGPSILETAETSFPLANGGQHIEQVTGRACQPIKPCYHQHIAGLEPAHQLASSARSAFAPETFSLNALAQPAAINSASCEPRSCPLVLTRA